MYLGVPILDASMLMSVNSSSCIDPFIIVQSPSLNFSMSFVLKPAYLVPSIGVPAVLSLLFAGNVFFCLSSHFQSVCLPCTEVGLLQTLLIQFAAFSLIGVQLINSVVFQVYSRVIQLYMCLFQIIFLVSLLKSPERSSVCCTVGPCWLSVLNNSSVYMLVQTRYLSLPPFLPG